MKNFVNEPTTIYHGTNRNGSITRGYTGAISLDPVGVTLPAIVGVVGKYDNVCGGCDMIKTQDEVVEIVKLMDAQVEFEFEVPTRPDSDCYARYAELARELGTKQYPFVFAFLDTPLSVCLDRVKARRKAKGNDPDKFNPDLVEQKWLNARRQFTKATEAMLNPVWVPYGTTSPFILKMIRQGHP